MSFDVLKQRIAVHLTSKQGTTSVDRLLERHSLRNKDSSLFHVFPFPTPLTAQRSVEELESVQLKLLSGTTLVVLYSVEGILDDATGDSLLFVLDRSTREDFQLHVNLERPMTFLILTVKRKSDGNEWASDEPFTSLADAVEELRIDCHPSAALMSTYREGMSILTRSSAALAHAEAIVDALDRGSGGVDPETALTDCCVWIQETLALVDEAFGRLLQNCDTGIQVIEAYMKRYTATKGLQGILLNPNGVFKKLEQRYIHVDGQSALQYRQRVTEVMLLVSEQRLEAMWASVVLSKVCLGLKLQNPTQQQSLDGINALIPALCKLVTVAFVCCSSSDTSGSNSSSAGTIPTSKQLPLLRALRQKLLPIVAANVVHKCSELLSLTTMFSVEAVPDASDQQGYLMPLCCRPAVAGKLNRVAECLSSFARWFHICGRALEENFPPPMYPTFRTTSSSDPSSEVSEDVVTSILHYAAMRCNNILAMISSIDEIGCGMMTREVRCLFDTMHMAAKAFPLLDGLHHKNWQLFYDTFHKTKTLRYVLVEPVVYQPLASLRDAASEGVLKQGAAKSAALPPFADDGDEEKTILRNRVTVLTDELRDVRAVLARMMQQYKQSQDGLQQAQEVNLVLMAEIRRLMLQSGNASSWENQGAVVDGYQAMVDGLAAATIPAGE